MIQRLNVTCGISALSLGQFGFNVLRELYRRKIQVTLFPKGQPDVSAYKLDPQFGQWLERSVNTRWTKLDRKVPTLALWHVRDSEFKPSDRQYLFSFHETDQPTEHELGIVNAQDHTFFSSNWTVSNFQTFGAPNVSFIPLGLDEDFAPIPHRLISDDITHWICVGKWEDLRKLSGTKVRAWIKRYGGNRKHQLTLCVNNPFFQKRVHPDGRVEGFDMNDVYANLFGAPDWQKAKPANVNVLPHLRTNAEMNQLYNSADIDLSGIARSEGWNLPAFTATALGKWSIVTNCTAHKDWATAENSILIEPSGTMVPANDGMFFRPGDQFSQGNFFDFTEEQILAAYEQAEAKAKTPNPAGAALRETFTYKRTVDEILAKIEATS